MGVQRVLLQKDDLAVVLGHPSVRVALPFPNC